MKIGIISDLHVDVNLLEGGQTLLDILVEQVKEKEIDYLLIAGDVSNNYELTLQTLDDFEQRAEVPCLFVPGNHDIWNVEHPGKKTWEIYKELQRFPRNLTKEPYHLDRDWVVIGDLGWYDYSFGGEGIDFSEFEQMEFNGRTWKDKLYTNWEMDTTEVHQIFYTKLKKQLEIYSDKKIILMTHVVPHSEFIVSPSSNPIWNYFNAFLGSEEYGDLITKYPIKYAVCGHVHYRKQERIGDSLIICSCLGYRREWGKHDNPKQELLESLVIIEI